MAVELQHYFYLREIAWKSRAGVRGLELGVGAVLFVAEKKEDGKDSGQEMDRFVWVWRLG